MSFRGWLGGSVAQSQKLMPEAIDRWIRQHLGDYSDLSDASWPRPDSRVWRITLPARRVFVKVSPSVQSFDRECRALTTTVLAAGIEAPRLIASDREACLIVTSEVPGEVVRAMEPPPRTEAALEIHQRAGAAIAAVHEQWATSDDPAIRDRRIAYLLDKSYRRESEGLSELSPEHRKWLEQARRAISTAAPGCSIALIHGDFQPRNWLWSAASSSLALIDFETQSVGFALEDFGWLFATTWLARPDLRSAFLAGYGSGIGQVQERFLAAFTVLESLEHVVGGLRTNSPEKTGRGLRALEVAARTLTADKGTEDE